MTEPPAPDFFDQVYAVTRQIPPGRVTTYGTISRLISGRATAARTVGWALAALPPDLVEIVPWWRVINAQGRVSTNREPGIAAEQRARLGEEGVQFGADGRVDLERFGWFGEEEESR